MLQLRHLILRIILRIILLIIPMLFYWYFIINFIAKSTFLQALHHILQVCPTFVIHKKYGLHLTASRINCFLT
ncbi:MAG TPA: hypothetical protein DEG55_05885 [Acidaminococcaceae bacterium]|nr:hypothetical protein [Acidaminococcaceae bacterium]